MQRTCVLVASSMIAGASNTSADSPSTPMAPNKVGDHDRSMVPAPGGQYQESSSCARFPGHGLEPAAGHAATVASVSRMACTSFILAAFLRSLRAPPLTIFSAHWSTSLWLGELSLCS